MIDCRTCIHKGTSFYYGLCPQNDTEILSQERNRCFYYERKTMPNIKITAEIDGKQVPLETVSAETFEAIKALMKEIPIARLADYCGHPRLIFRPTKNIELNVGHVYALHLTHGDFSNRWMLDRDSDVVKQYENVKPL